MKFKIDDSITNRNVEYAIKYLFDSDNISHQAIIIYQLNKLINNSDILLSLRKFIFKNSNKIKQYSNSLDTCGTGGDGLKTLNISTTVAILLSSVDIPIAKHGNRAASSLSGSSDIISELNISSEKDSKKIINKISNDKFVYLNAPFFLIRSIIYVIIWIYCSRKLRQLSIKGDLEGDIGERSFFKGLRVSGWFLVFFAVSSCTAAWDWIMSIDTHWFSTLFGWYIFSEWATIGFTTILLIALFLQPQDLYLHFF